MMMMKKISVLFLLVILLITTVNVVSVIADGEDSPVYITSNSDFALNPLFVGEGIAENPYVLDNGYLNSISAAAIYIVNTDVYVILSDLHINGTGYYGIYLKNVSNLNITNCDIVDKKAAILIEECSRIFVSLTTITNQVENDYGIRIDVSDSISIRNCNFYVADAGIQLWNSFRVEIVDNVFIGTGISFYGTCQISTSILITGNMVNGKPLGYFYNHHDESYNISGYGQVILISCVNIILYDGDIRNTNVAVQFIFSQNCVLQDSLVYNNKIGVLLYESSSCRVLRNNIVANREGVVGYFAFGTIITENNILANTHIGLWAYYGCSSSVIYLNNFHLEGFDDNGVDAQDDGGIEDSNLIWIGVRFVNSVSGWPLSNVSVTLEQGDRSYTGYSNENGLFKVPLPNTGPYNVSIEKFRYQSKNILNYDKIQEGINIYNIGLVKADLGLGTGYGIVRFEDDVTSIGIPNVDVRVYSYLDGAYYFHSNYTSTAVTPIGWVNITGLYYDNYTIVITHPSYERNILQKVVIETGEAPWSGYHMPLTHYPTDAFIYGVIKDSETELPLENANITLINELGQHAHYFTDIDGFFNITNIPFGVYQVEISLITYLTEYTSFVIDEGGSQNFNPIEYFLISEDYVPSEPLGAVVNNWDNEVVGNYWGDVGGVIVLVSEGGYLIPGSNLDNPEDEYPLSEPVVFGENNNPITTLPIENIDDFNINIIFFVMSSVTFVSALVLLVFIYKKRE